MRKLILSVGVGLLVCMMATLALADAKSFNLQGRLTDSGGDPVADGAHTLDFAIYTEVSGGALLWSEVGIVVNTTDGLFSTQVGESNPINPGVFFGHDSLWLEIFADGETMSPRTYLTAAPFAKQAEAIMAYSAFYDVMSIQTNADVSTISTFGSDSLEQIRLWGDSWGEIFLYDESPSNHQAAVLTAEGSFGSSQGGALFLNRDAGGTMSLNAHLLGDASASLFADAINATEMLNEPGLANADGPNFVTFSSGTGNYPIDSVVITVPTAGYITLDGGGYMNLVHTNGTDTEVWVVITDNLASAGLHSGVAVCRINSSAPTGLWQMPARPVRSYQVSAGTHKFYLVADYNQGVNTSTNAAFMTLRAMYFPTLYGSLTIAESVGGVQQTRSDMVVEGLTDTRRTITVEEHKAMVEAELADQRAELEERIRRLEERLDDNSQAAAYQR